MRETDPQNPRLTTRKMICIAAPPTYPPFDSEDDGIGSLVKDLSCLDIRTCQTKGEKHMLRVHVVV